MSAEKEEKKKKRKKEMRQEFIRYAYKQSPYFLQCYEKKLGWTCIMRNISAYTKSRLSWL